MWIQSSSKVHEQHDSSIIYKCWIVNSVVISEKYICLHRHSVYYNFCHGMWVFYGFWCYYMYIICTLKCMWTCTQNGQNTKCDTITEIPGWSRTHGWRYLASVNTWVNLTQLMCFSVKMNNVIMCKNMYNIPIHIFQYQLQLVYLNLFKLQSIKVTLQWIKPTCLFIRWTFCPHSSGFVSN